MSESDLILCFVLGSLFGVAITAGVAMLYHARKLDEAADEIAAIRETLRRHAYAKGYEDARVGGLKRS